MRIIMGGHATKFVYESTKPRHKVMELKELVERYRAEASATMERLKEIPNGQRFRSAASTAAWNAHTNLDNLWAATEALIKELADDEEKARRKVFYDQGVF